LQPNLGRCRTNETTGKQHAGAPVMIEVGQVK